MREYMYVYIKHGLKKSRIDQLYLISLSNFGKSILQHKISIFVYISRFNFKFNVVKFQLEHSKEKEFEKTS